MTLKFEPTNTWTGAGNPYYREYCLEQHTIQILLSSIHELLYPLTPISIAEQEKKNISICLSLV